MTTPIIAVKEGQLKGIRGRDFLGNNYYSFLGIPYGKAPIGQLRFKAPIPAEPWEGVLDATKEGPACPSKHTVIPCIMGSEDNCLNLNVYTRHLPKNGDSSLKPVMVWIHGGSFLYGSNKREMYGPDYLIAEDIVLVSINYRLGVLGFLSLKDPSLEVPGNAGLKDMILALRWVQRNIKTFNGDPDNVTIFGESAGSASVHYLCLSRLSKGLFHKAIAQSGCSLNFWTKGCRNGEEIAKNLEFNETDEKQILEYLQSLPPHKIVKAQHKTLDPFNAGTVRPFGPVVEEYLTETAFLTEQPVDIIKSGRYNHVPTIFGYNSADGMLYEMYKYLEPKRPPVSEINFEDEIDYDLKLKMSLEKCAELADKIKRFYFGKEKPSEDNVEKLHLLKTDNTFVHGILRSIHCQKTVSKTPIYLYKMSLETSLNLPKRLSTTTNIYLFVFLQFLASISRFEILENFFLKLANLIPKKSYYGVCHGDDLNYLFKSRLSVTLKPETMEEISVKRFIKLWANFARTGNPTPDKNDPLINIEWKPVTEQDDYYLDIGMELKVGKNPDSERMEFWDNIYG